MKAVLAACCLFAVYLFFVSADAKAPGVAAPPPPPDGDSSSGSCFDNNNTTRTCVPWKAAGHCDTTDAKKNCAKTCEQC
uniref:ShKL14 n=1 Tax=Colubraria reticulata TaxID=604273 RepID=A0A481SQ32_9CAEN|nr:ShKL14 [Colubraria reticulata]